MSTTTPPVRFRPGSLLALLSLATAGARAQGGAVFDRVAEVLGDSFYDRDFRAHELPPLVERLRPRALAATSAAAERDVIAALLAEVPASHLALYSEATWRHLQDELVGRAAPTFGCVLTRLRGGFFVSAVLDGGPAASAGVQRGDRVLAIDGEPPAASARLDWRADDAYLPDPPVHQLLANDGDTVHLRVEATPGDARDVALRAATTSAYEASRRSCGTVQVGERTFGCLHLWLVFHNKSASLVRSAGKRFAATDGLLIDLRGRGGSGLEVQAIVKVLEERCSAGVPMVFLIDEGTRSAKEVLAYEIRERHLGLLVGERTAGAVLPASFEDVGGGAVLMFPRTQLGSYTRAIEGIGVTPHLTVADELPFANGRDPIRDAGLRALAQLAELR